MLSLVLLNRHMTTLTRSSLRLSLITFKSRRVHTQCQEVEAESNPNTRHLYDSVVPKIGLEVHAQLKVKSKLFSRASTEHGLQSNSQVDLLDIAIPGSLPKLNLAALESAALTAMGLNCDIQQSIHFDRKNYFYFDMPAGFQITQYNKPLAKGGYLDFIVTTYHKSLIAHSQQYDIVKYLYSQDRFQGEQISPYIKRSQIKQIQLEQDSAKTLIMNENQSLDVQFAMIDYNRSGCGLIEIVFEPDLRNHHEASSMVKELIRVLRSLKTCDCELEHGSLRIDANVSIQSIDGHIINNSPRVELKNLNSLKALNKAILHEIKRQSALILKGQKVLQESRIYLSHINQTTPLRLKEDAIDYRYVPEPSLPPLDLDEKFIGRIRNRLPTSLPHTIREKVREDYNLDLILVDELLDESGMVDYFYKVLEESKTKLDPRQVADFLIYTIANLKQLNYYQIPVDCSTGSEFRRRLTTDVFHQLFNMIQENEVSYAFAYEVMKHIYLTDDRSDVGRIIDKLGGKQINDKDQIAEICSESIKLMKNISKKYSKKGDKKYLRMMLDKICQVTGNRINLKQAIEYINVTLRSSK